jgi:hypothetical protein
VCEVKGKREGHYVIHSTEPGSKPHEHLLGSWMVAEAEKGLLDWCPVASIGDDNSAANKQRKVRTCPHVMSLCRPSHEITRLTAANVTVGTSGGPQHVFLRDCEGCTFTIARAVKLTIERCANCTVRITGPVVSGTAEVIRCCGIAVEASVVLPTVTIDLSTAVSLVSKQWPIGAAVYICASTATQVESVSPRCTLKHSESSAEQQIVQMVNGSLVCEQVLRWEGYATTEREKALHQERLAANLEKLFASPIISSTLSRATDDTRRKIAASMSLSMPVPTSPE